MKTYVVTPHKNRFSETVLMMGHKICFYGEKWLIIPKFSLLPLLNWNTDCKGNIYTSRGSNFAIFIFILCLKGELIKANSVFEKLTCLQGFVCPGKQTGSQRSCKNDAIHFNCKFTLGINKSFFMEITEKLSLNSYQILVLRVWF